MHFWLLLEGAGIVHESLAVRPSSPGFKLQLTSNMTFSKPLNPHNVSFHSC